MTGPSSEESGEFRIPEIWRRGLQPSRAPGRVLVPDPSARACTVAVCSVVDPHCIKVRIAYSEEVRNCPWVHGLRGERYHHRKPLLVAVGSRPRCRPHTKSLALDLM